jgi:hypothetical protein
LPNRTASAFGSERLVIRSSFGSKPARADRGVGPLA